MDSEPTAANITEVECNAVGELLKILSPYDGHFVSRSGMDFIFRGQRDCRWPLIPKVFRTDIIKLYKRGMLAVSKDHPGQWAFEYTLLRGFMGCCDSAGLSVPNDSMDFRKYFEMSNLSNLHGIDSQGWPQDRVVPLMALAQHHGIPTRLLDWSDNPLVACYHAASTSVVEGDESGKLAIFALEESRINSSMAIRKIRVPGSISPNISVQQGSFILVANAGMRGDKFTPDVSLESRLPSHGRSMLHKITLPNALAPDLLLACGRYGISASSVFPGYDGCARAQLETMQAYNRRAERPL